MLAAEGPPLDERRLHFVLGKGGAGKSTVSAALGLAAAAAGRRALIVEVAGERRLSRLFAVAGAGNGEETELAPGLYGISIDADAATEEYLAGQLPMRRLVEMLTRSRAFHTFAAAAPGLAELVTVGKVWSLAIALREDGSGPLWDLVIVDCPATGHGIALLETAGNVEELAGGGPIREQAGRIREVVTHPAATGITLVARPEELSVTEAVEAAALLRERGLPVAAAVLNGVREDRFDDAEVPALEAVAAGPGPVGDAARRALDHLRRRRADEEHRRRLADGTGVPLIELPEVVGRRDDARALAVLADALEGTFAAAGAGAGGGG